MDFYMWCKTNRHLMAAVGAKDGTTTIRFKGDVPNALGVGYFKSMFKCSHSNQRPLRGRTDFMLFTQYYKMLIVLSMHWNFLVSRVFFIEIVSFFSFFFCCCWIHREYRLLLNHLSMDIKPVWGSEKNKMVTTEGEDSYYFTCGQVGLFACSQIKMA